jgi:hypothetical protein
MMALTRDEHLKGARDLLSAAKAEKDLKTKGRLWARAQMALFLAEKRRSPSEIDTKH